MAFQRYQRVSSLIEQELTKIIIRELEFDGALPTVTHVEVQKDLDYAAIHVSVLPSIAGEKVLSILQKSSSHLRHLLLKKINIKPMPEIRFILDLGPEKAASVEKVFIEIEKEGKNR